jgi:hypothetical protein
MVVDEASRRRAARMQRGVLWLSKHWLRLVIGFFALYAGLPFMAPVLMHVGAEGPARVIYAIYSPMCHQFAFVVSLRGAAVLSPRGGGHG